MSTIAVPNDVTSVALSAVDRTRRVHDSLLRFTTLTRLDAMPGEIDAALAQLRTLKIRVADIRQANGLTRRPKAAAKPQGEDQ